MKITYDSQVDAMYIRFVDEPVQVTTQRLSEEIAVNYAPDGRVVGIEILDASEYAFRSEDIPTVTLDNIKAIIHDAA